MESSLDTWRSRRRSGVWKFADLSITIYYTLQRGKINQRSLESDWRRASCELAAELEAPADYFLCATNILSGWMLTWRYLPKDTFMQGYSPWIWDNRLALATTYGVPSRPNTQRQETFGGPLSSRARASLAYLEWLTIFSLVTQRIRSSRASNTILKHSQEIWMLAGPLPRLF